MLYLNHGTLGIGRIVSHSPSLSKITFTRNGDNVGVSHSTWLKAIKPKCKIKIKFVKAVVYM